MPLYEADSSGRKQQPIARTGTAFYSNAVCPTNEIITKRPSYVNVNSIGTYAFLYETTASAGANVAVTELDNFVTGSFIQANDTGGIRLDISPVAWRRTDGTDGAAAVTFVYVRVS
tara:strand:- start:154 stop:501 length:348 start_codon:yes stop_codon:yes gene_type:complete